jgi:mRNA-degrading endonuclease RelE of RelBE toxin-antitoxin system
MRPRFTPRFERSYAVAPAAVQRAFDKQLRFLLQNLRHPSLDAKKYPESGDPDTWQARITKGWRFYFRIVADTYELLEMIKHAK